MTATVVQLRPTDDIGRQALVVYGEYVEGCKLSPNTKRAYRRQAAQYVDWVATNLGLHPDAFLDQVGAESAMTSWRRELLARGLSGSTVNQGLAAVTLLYQIGLRIHTDVKRNRIPEPGAPKALTKAQEGAVQRAADRRGARDSAVISLLRETGARLEECARLRPEDLVVTARTGRLRLLGKGDQERHVPVPPSTRTRITAWLDERAKLVDGKPDPGTLWIGKHGAFGMSGIKKLVAAIGRDAGIEGLTPHVLRHTYATRLRQDGHDPAVIQKLLGHKLLVTTQRYFRASDEEVAAAVARTFGE